MARPKGTTKQPSYRLHRASGRAVTTIDGKDHYLGAYESAASRSAYDRLMAEWYARGRQGPSAAGETCTIAQLAAGYLEAHKAAWKGGKCGYTHNAMGWLVKHYGPTKATEFSSFQLKAIRKLMCAAKSKGKGRQNLPISRNYINGMICRIQSIFSWGCEMLMVPSSVSANLNAVEPLPRGHAEAVDHPWVMPVDQCHIDAVIEVASPVIRAMILLQLYSGARPGELRIMRTADIDTTGATWRYQPAQHKTQRYGKTRTVFFGPRSQDILRPFLRAELNRAIFSPRDAVSCGSLLVKRKVPTYRKVTYRNTACVMIDGKTHYLGRYGSEESRQKYSELINAMRNRPADQITRFSRRPAAAVKEIFSAASYLGAVVLCCDKADRLAHARRPEVPADVRIIPRWHPYQLRHNAATCIAEEFGEDVARAVCGHSSVRTTHIYIDKQRLDEKKASSAMASMG
jgi:integrase